MTNENIAKQIKTLFENHNFNVINHEKIHSAKEGANTRGHSLDQGIKAMVVKSKSDRYFMFALSGDKKIDFSKVKDILGEKAKLASPEEVFNITKCKIGSVPPIGQLFNIPMYIDETLLGKTSVYFSIGSHYQSGESDIDTFLKVVKCKKEKFSK